MFNSKGFVNAAKVMSTLMIFMLTVSTIITFAEIKNRSDAANIEGLVTTSSAITLEEAGYGTIMDTKALLNYIEPEPVDLIPTFPFDVICGKLNVRSGPSLNDKVVDAYYKGTQFICSDVEGDWYKTPDGWVHSDYLRPAFRINVKDINEVYKPKVKLNTVLTQPSGLTVEQVEKLIAGTGYSDCAESFCKYEEEYGVNVLFTLAVAKQESGSGRSRKARRENNIFGMKTKPFASKADCIRYFNSLIVRAYIKSGRTTISTIGPKYCTEGTAGWIAAISDIMGHYERSARKIIE